MKNFTRFPSPDAASPVVVDRWIGGSSPFSQRDYRIVLLPTFPTSRYRLESKHVDDPDTCYVEVVNYSCGDVVARGIMKWVLEDYEEHTTEGAKGSVSCR